MLPNLTVQAARQPFNQSRISDFDLIEPLQSLRDRFTPKEAPSIVIDKQYDIKP